MDALPPRQTFGHILLEAPLYVCIIEHTPAAKLLQHRAETSATTQVDIMKIETNNYPARPTQTPEIVMQVATGVELEMRRIGEAVNSVERAEQIADAYINHGPNAFDIAKKLDSFGWTISGEDIQILDAMNHEVSDLVVEAEEQWVKVYNVQPALSIGTEIAQGVITGICDFNPARYLVKERGCTGESRRLLVKFECAQPVNDLNSTNLFVMCVTKRTDGEMEFRHLCEAPAHVTTEMVERVALNVLTSGCELIRASEAYGDNVFLSEADPDEAISYWVNEVKQVDPSDADTLKKYLPVAPYGLLLKAGEVEIL